MNATSNQSNPYAPPSAKVEDAIEKAETELAGRGVRLGAVVIDGLLFFLAVYLPLIIAIGSDILNIFQYPQAVGSIVRALTTFTIGGLISLIDLIAYCVVTFILVKRNSQTIGKKLLRIKVVRSDGSPISLARIFWMRNVIGAVITLIPSVGRLYGLVDALFIFGAKRQCLHDKIADSIVVEA